MSSHQLRHRLARSLLLCIWLCLASWPRSAAAVDVATTYANALKLFKQQQYADALPLFRGAYAASNSPNAHLFIARCLRELGDLPAAYEAMRDTVTEATTAARTNAKYAPTRDSAAAELALLEPQIGKLLVAVADPPEGIRVVVNDRTVDISELAQPRAVKPGTTTCIIEAPGKERIERTIDIPAGQMRAIAVSLLETAKADDADGARDEAAETSGGGVRVAGYVMASVGLVGVGIFAVTAARAQSQFDELDAKCAGSPCPAEDGEAVEEGRALTTVANITIGVSAAAVVAGLAMIIWGGPDETDDGAALSIIPTAGPGAAGVMLHGRF